VNIPRGAGFVVQRCTPVCIACVGLGVANVFACAAGVFRGIAIITRHLLGYRLCPIPRLRSAVVPAASAAGSSPGGTLGILLAASITMILFGCGAEKSWTAFLAASAPSCCW